MKKWIAKHPVATVVISIIVVIALYFIIKSIRGTVVETRYILGNARRMDIVTSVSGTGQVSALNQINLSSKSSGDLVYLNAKAGQFVGAGGLIAEIDSTDASFELESAKISYEQFLKDSANGSIDKEDIFNQAKISLADSYQNARSTLSSATTDMADVVSGIEDLLKGYLSGNNSSALSNTEKDYVRKAEVSYYKAENALDEFLKSYVKISDKTSNTEITSAISDLSKVSDEVAVASKFTKDAVVYLRDREDKLQTDAESAYTSVNSLVTKANSTVSDTLSAKNSIISAEKTLRNTQIDFENVRNGPDALSLRSEELALRQKEEAYKDHFIYAPFDGVIASVPVLKGDTVSSGTTIATFITKKKIAEISLNEIDAAKVKAGQKVSLTFDAIDGLTISGEVTEVDLVGTVSQGVVNYNVKIGFDVDDDRVKSGMTVSATIITDKKEGVIVVPTSAIKTIRNNSFIDITKEKVAMGSTTRTTGVLLTTLPKSVQVELGISNDDSTEIISGLEEGQQYILRTITSATTQAPTQTSSLFGTGNRSTGNALRSTGAVPGR